MKLPIPLPRLLPLTILVMAALAGVKSVALVRAALPTEAVAAEPATPPAKPAEPHAVTAAPASNAVEPSAAKAERPTPAGETKPVAVAAAGAAPAAAPAAGTPPVGEAERAVLLDLRERRKQLEARDAEMQAREQVLAAAEHRLSARLDELTALRGRLEALETARKDRDESNWRSMVKLYESMKPRDAATIFNDLDMPVLLQVVDRMKEARAAPVLAAMQPERARLLTAELAQLRAKANTAAPAATPQKGG